MRSLSKSQLWITELKDVLSAIPTRAILKKGEVERART